jgi:hypothetical protein
MTQHGWDVLSDVSGDTGPCRTGPKREWLWHVLTEWCCEELQRFDVGVVHDLIPLSVKHRRREDHM